MIETSRPLPEFEVPPVDEVVIGVQYPPIDGWKIPHIGLYWSLIRKEYPNCDTQMPLPNQFEDFSRIPFAQQVLQVNTDPNDVRCWFISRDETELLQIQPGRFIRNWRKVVGDEVYPRYKVLRPAFVNEWMRFCEFVRDLALPLPQVAECEITYINNIQRGIGWTQFSDLSKVTPLWAGGQSEGYLPGPESVNLGLSYLTDETVGRLKINLRHILRLKDGKEFLQLTLTGKGKPESSSTVDIMNWIDKGREWIVRAFADITTAEMHQIWRKST